MRLEYTFKIDEVAVPRFSVEAVEGIGKVFTLATMVLNVLDVKPKVELVFHGLNPDDPSRKIDAFRKIVESATSTPTLGRTYSNILMWLCREAAFLRNCSRSCMKPATIVFPRKAITSSSNISISSDA